MDWRFTSNIFLLLVATALSTRLAYYAWKRRPTTGSTLFTLLMLALAEWVLAYTLEITSSALVTKLVWAKFQFLGAVIMPVAWLVFVLKYASGEPRISRRTVHLLSLLPAVTFVLAVTNEAHGWIWSRVTLQQAGTASPTMLVEYSFWFWIHAAFSYGCLAAATIMLVTQWRRGNVALYRWQSATLLVGMLLPWAGQTLSIAGMDPKEIVSLSFLISSMALVHFTLYYRLFDIAPVAHRAIFNSISDGIFIIDPWDRIADANPAAERVVGLSTRALMGKRLNTIWSQIFGDERPVPGRAAEVTAVAQDEPKHYEVTVTPLSDWRENLKGQLLVLHDITRRKELERLRDNMTHTMVHDLRDPLSNSLFALELLKGDLFNPNSSESGQLLDLTVGNTIKTLDLVDEILEIDRLNARSSMAITRDSVSLADLISRVVNSQMSPAKAKLLKILVAIPDALPPVWADTRLIERVLVNILDNSIKFSPEAGTVRITVEETAADKSLGVPRLLVSVSDEGPGIPEKTQERIFEKFVTGTDRRSGSGLGLAFCKMAILAHGEQIWVESEPGEGTTFTFTLPVSFQRSPV